MGFIEEYKDHTIEYDEAANLWLVIDSAHKAVYQASIPKMCRLWVDKALKEERKIDREAYYIDFWDIKPVVVISKASESEVWVKTDRRQKVKLSNICAKSNKNDQLVGDIKSIKEQIQTLSQEQAKKRDQLEPFEL